MVVLVICVKQVKQTGNDCSIIDSIEAGPRTTRVDQGNIL
jgi:hypothetical protein